MLKTIQVETSVYREGQNSH